MVVVVCCNEGFVHPQVAAAGGSSCRFFPFGKTCDEFLKGRVVFPFFMILLLSFLDQSYDFFSFFVAVVGDCKGLSVFILERIEFVF